MARLTNRILIVEDDHAIRHLMSAHFRRSGFHVEYAVSAEEVAADEPYDVVLTDVHLPGESGVEMARRIHGALPDQRVVFMTGDSDPELARAALDDGAAGYLMKPFELFELDAVVGTALRTLPAVRPPVSMESRRFAVLTSSGSNVPSGTDLSALAIVPHVTAPAKVVLSPRKSHSRTSKLQQRLRVAAAVVLMLGASWGAGMAIAPAKVGTTDQNAMIGGNDSKPIVVPIMIDKTVYLNNSR